ncbi:hypothetical protein [Streptomyces sp. NPDC090798]|uniref:hypothetical protein n=1 Tax=Streptomyces sp. NPDC090798 TaxID=3365968 RepID=UPI003807BE7C
MPDHRIGELAEGSGQRAINGVDYDSPTYDGPPGPGLGLRSATHACPPVCRPTRPPGPISGTPTTAGAFTPAVSLKNSAAKTPTPRHSPPTAPGGTASRTTPGVFTVDPGRLDSWSLTFRPS